MTSALLCGLSTKAVHTTEPYVPLTRVCLDVVQSRQAVLLREEHCLLPQPHTAQVLGLKTTSLPTLMTHAHFVEVNQSLTKALVRCSGVLQLTHSGSENRAHLTCEAS